MGMANMIKMRTFKQNLNSLKIELENKETTTERLREIALTLHQTLLNTVNEATKRR